MRVNKGKPSPLHHILIGNIPHKHRFTHSSRTYHIHMPTPIFRRQSYFLRLATKFIHANQHPLVHQLRWPFHLLRHLSHHLARRYHVLLRQMENTRQLHAIQNVLRLAEWKISQYIVSRQFSHIFRHLVFKPVI